jgi:uncharacterized membrane protein
MNILPLVQNLPPRARLSTALGCATLVFLGLPPVFALNTRLLAAWTVAVSCLLGLMLLMISSATPEVTRDRARRYRNHNWVVFALMSSATFSSLFAITLLLSVTKDESALLSSLHVGLSALAIGSSWFLMHTTFAQQYAALYYHPDASGNDAGGLRFTADAVPSYWDFIYFSFVIGATSQTSDTFILSRPMRRLALGQALISFLFLVGILAMCVNIGSGLLGKG